MFLPKQNEAPHSAPPNQPLKRKRSSSTDLDSDFEQSQESAGAPKQPESADAAWPGAQSQWSGRVTAPHYPAQGLPTPLLSPTDSRMDMTQLPLSQANSESPQDSGARRRHARQVIQQQINLEILLKHNELRLIDQELAKCQTALEQLRRCEEIPFPVSQPSLAVSTGRGSAIRSSFPSQLPESPPAWGVTDGPYTRHYAHWLLPDSRFDGGDPEPVSAISGKRPIKVRSLTGSYANEPVIGMSSRSQRGSTFKAPFAGYSQPKEKAQGPLVLKRKSDGAMVKLICPVCSRGDFGSAQGFINHCRIGHGRSFSSHDQAAEQCGEPVTVDEHGAIVGQELATTPTSNNVHPLIRTARLQHVPSSPPPNPRFLGLDGAAEPSEGARSPISPDFRASFQTPHLSNLIQSKGLGFNLECMVDEAKIKVELPEPSEQMEEMDEEPAYESSSSQALVARTGSNKKPAKSSLPSPVLHSGVMDKRNINLESMGISSLDIPSITVDPEPSPSTESNQAPSLIDDDEEYEVHSPASSSASDMADDGEVDFTVRDDDDFHGHVDLAKPEPQSSCTQAAVHQSPPPPRIRRPSVLRSPGPRGEAKQHAILVDEVQGGTLKTGGDAKRRRISKKMKLLTLATCLLSLPFALADEAPVVNDNPRHVGYSASLQADKPIQGTIVGVSSEDGTGVLVAISLFSFPDGLGPFEYHIHEKPVPSNGSCNATGGHLNPYNGTKPPGCDPEMPSLCEVGDLSGKYGLVENETLAESPFFQNQFLDSFLSTSNDSITFLGNRSFVIHAANGTRLNCGNFELAGVNLAMALGVLGAVFAI
ncbi:hypothetical protein DV735_g5900, partial [Chaetothyriales sp. CBS 134920]